MDAEAYYLDDGFDIDFDKINIDTGQAVDIVLAAHRSETDFDRMYLLTNYPHIEFDLPCILVESLRSKHTRSISYCITKVPKTEFAYILSEWAFISTYNKQKKRYFGLFLFKNELNHEVVGHILNFISK